MSVNPAGSAAAEHVGKPPDILVIYDVRDFVIAPRSKPEWNKIRHSGEHQFQAKSDRLNTPGPPLFPFAAFTAAAGGCECGEGDGVWLRYAALVFKPLVHWGKPSGERRLRLTSCHSSKLGGGESVANAELQSLVPMSAACRCPRRVASVFLLCETAAHRACTS